MDKTAELEQSQERINLCFHKGPFKEGEKISAGWSLVSDMELTYRGKDFEPVRVLFDTYRKNIGKPSPPDKRLMDELERGDKITASQARDLVSALKAIEDFNGGDLSNNLSASRDRSRLYKDSAVREVGIGEFKGKQMIQCSEIAILLHDIFSHTNNYESIFVESAVTYLGDEAQGHSFVLVRPLSGESRYLLLDFSYQVTLADRSKSVPFCSSLSKDQVEGLEKGEDISCEMLGVKHTYRIGTPFTPSGSWKSSFE